MVREARLSTGTAAVTGTAIFEMRSPRGIFKAIRSRTERERWRNPVRQNKGNKSIRKRLPKALRVREAVIVRG